MLLNAFQHTNRKLNFFCAGLIVVPTLSDNPAPKSTLWQAGLVREQWEQNDC